MQAIAPRWLDSDRRRGITPCSDFCRARLPRRQWWRRDWERCADGIPCELIQRGEEACPPVHVSVHARVGEIDQRYHLRVGSKLDQALSPPNPHHRPLPFPSRPQARRGLRSKPGPWRARYAHARFTDARRAGREAPPGWACGFLRLDAETPVAGSVCVLVVAHAAASLCSTVDWWHRAERDLRQCPFAKGDDQPDGRSRPAGGEMHPEGG